MRRRIPRFVFLIIFLAIGAGGAFFASVTFLPSVVITLSPTVTEHTAEQTITLLGNTTEPDFRRFILPAKVVEATVSEEAVIQRDAGEIRDDFAQGTVRFINKQLDEQRLLPKTHLRHEETGVFFLTDSATVIPPQSEITIGITAKEAGKHGNVPAGKFVVDKLSSGLQEVIFAESDAPLSGGQVAEATLSAEEIDEAKAAVRAAAEERLTGELVSQAGGAAIRQDLSTTSIEEETVSAEAGSAVASFVVRLTLKARAFVVDENDLLSLTLLKLRSGDVSDAEFVEYTPESFTATIVQANFDRTEARINGQLTGLFAQNIESSVFNTSALAGRTESEVREYFEAFESVGDVEITFSPFWVTRVPARGSAVTIAIE